MRQLILSVIVLLTGDAWAQTNRYFVFFKDKNNSPYSISDPGLFLTQKSIARRAKAGVSVSVEDLPVNSSYVSQVKALGVNTYFTSKWWNGVLVQANVSKVSAIQSLPFVLKIEFVAPGTLLIGGRQSSPDKGNQNESINAQNDFQLQQLQLDKMQQDGYRGEGVDVAQFDSGWRGVNLAGPFQHLVQEGRIKSVFNFVKNTANVYSDDDHGTEVLSVMGALSPSSFIGGVYKANFHLFETEDKLTEYRIEEYNWAFAAERADSLGIDVINSSLGYSTFDDPAMDYTIFDLTGKKAVVTITARKAVEKGMIVVTSAGNDGNNSFWKFITTPADGEGVIAVGSTTSMGVKSSFSSIGPTTDLRIKPDAVALGSGTAVIKSDGAAGSASGTSFASPLVACLAAGLVQAFPTSSPFQIYQAIIRSASIYKTPNNQLGYGIPNFTIAKSYLTYGDLKDDVSIFPNPISTSNLNLLFKEPAGQQVSVTIFDLYGKVVSDATVEVNWSNNPLQYNFTNLPNGVYILRIKSDRINLTTRLVKTD